MFLGTVLKCVVLLSIQSYHIFAHEVETYDVLMPNVRPTRDEQYICSQIRIAPRTSFSIVGFIPNATMETVHHMLLYGCTTPGSYEKAWDCGGGDKSDGDSHLVTAPVCKSGNEIIYAWARDAPQLDFPPEVGRLVGSGTQIKHLVLQIHYQHKFEVGQFDNSGLFLKYTREALTRRAGIYFLGTGGYIPKHSTEHMEVACQMEEDKVMHPFAYRTHTHTLGKVVAGYVVKHPYENDEDWLILGKRNPMTPQMFYPTLTNETINKGDVLAARCTMANNRDRDTYVGGTNEDEMCNFYLMYWVEGTDILKNDVCNSNGPPSYYWAHNNFTNIPDLQASTL